ncbi:redoxin family protein [Zhouia spongiae]|uniref:Redoxin family protein n=1 Tax=Zhouia spongiae TaxID=2202721 RepID=A0ABY3YKY4_9FLAO|nr:thioredoxin-like domain-containing protein [Zhouia spongiae]UNY98348.1 redoxin family protein [Zhouia spongiae]
MKVLDFIIGILCLVSVSSCKTANNESDERVAGAQPVVITGQILGSDKTVDSIQIYFGGDIPFNRRLGVDRQRVKTDENKYFKYTSPLTNKPERFYLFSLRNRDKKPYLAYGDNIQNYLVQPGDSIHITIDQRGEETKFSFSGRGSAKFTALWRADQLVSSQESFKAIVDAEIKLKGLKGVDINKARMTLGDSILKAQLNTLEQYKKEVDPYVFQIMQADILGNVKSKYKSSFNIKAEELTEKKAALYKRLIEESLQADLPDDVLAESPFYVRYLSNITMTELKLNNPGDASYNKNNIQVKHFGEFCSLLRNSYSGYLREKLILFNLQSMRVQDTYGLDECLQASYALIKTPELKKIIDDWYGKKIRGAKAYNFSLTDVHGNEVQLSDFKGKVVYLDIWFTGCGGCLALAKEVDHKVYPEFKDNKDVAFVSISFDKSKKQWLKSVESQKYGLKEYVNLYTSGLGIEHPFLKYYGVRGGPTTMIIDRKGRIYSSAPPKQGKAYELIALIQEALRN